MRGLDAAAATRPPRPRGSPVVRTAVAAVAALTLAVAARTASFDGISSARGLLLLQAATGLVALLVSFVLWGRYAVTEECNDLLLVAAMFLFGAGTLLFLVMPRLSGGT